jgi:hypothetical protein
MPDAGSFFLLAGALCSFGAGVIHLVCIAVGPRAYRFLGAGERMARAAERGSRYPALITFAIAALLFGCGVVALSGAGFIPELPFTKPALVVISAVYLLRAVSFPLLRPIFPENSRTFWLLTSGISLAIGLLHGLGTFFS